MSKATAQPITVTVDEQGQTVLIYPAVQTQQAQAIGVSMPTAQTVEIQPAT